MKEKLATLEAEKVSLTETRDRLTRELDARVKVFEGGKESWFSKIATNIVKLFRREPRTPHW